MSAINFSTWLQTQFAGGDVSAKAVANRAGISQSYLSGLRSGIRERPSIEIAERLAEAFAELRGLEDSARSYLSLEARDAATARPEAPTTAAEARRNRPMLGLNDLYRQQASHGGRR